MGLPSMANVIEVKGLSCNKPNDEVLRYQIHSLNAQRLSAALFSDRSIPVFTAIIRQQSIIQSGPPDLGPRFQMS